MDRGIIEKKDVDSLARCRRQIEQVSGLGSGEGWTTADFDHLSEAILATTGACLSVTTLKRVWGKVRYDSSPTTTTLNVLVQYLGYSNWHDFQDQAPQPNPVADRTLPRRIDSSPVHTNSRRLGNRVIHYKVAICLIGLLTFMVVSDGQKPLSPQDFSFRSRPVTYGIPNSVVFDYDATASPTDSVFIQQSWDPTRRQLVSRTGHQHTSIYYHPGYFLAKLVVGKQIVREHDLLIRSDGWHIAVLQEPVPVYFKADEVIGQGKLSLPVSLIESSHVPMQPQPPVVRYRYIRELAGLRSDNFVFETRLRHDYRIGAAACQQTRLMIHGVGDMFFIPLSAKGCVSDLFLGVADHQVDGHNTDLSAFGVNLSKWVTLRCAVIQNKARIWVNGQLAYQAIIRTSPVDLVGITYEFTGTGSVDYCRFSRPTGELVFADSFDSRANPLTSKK
ncbi:hypothetical protein [Spirosoma linguale]|uniref:Uncharacterized protein n=1 Tax=Spirosoma linguale (strain ATCC 33905 / DSM 74 / LMG 10896 / Claus 1) TaxID=504472 RepID=D2QR93_SPILD|nr:hypothetical protein Slin_3640 [Spirosoma linguale DSM 74]